MVERKSTHHKGDIARKALLGIGYWVQGLRCFPWLVVNFFLKDTLDVNPSTLQILQNSANLPMVAKPLYGVVSDAFYIQGEHRIPYIALGAFLQAIAWLAIALLSPTRISSIAFYLLLSNLGAAIAEVANDAVVAELAGQPAPSSLKKSSSSSSGGEFQSFVWMASSLGGAFGNLIAVVAIGRLSPQSMFSIFGLLATLQFLITISVRESSLNLPKASSSNGIKKQLSELLSTLRRPEISYPIMWLAASYAVIPALTGTMFFYQTQQLKIDTSVLGISKVFGQATMLLWSVVYNKYLKSVGPRRLISAVQATMAVLTASDILFVKGVYRTMGIPDSLYVILISGFLEVVLFFKILPFSVLISQVCPPGCEGSLMAFAMSVVALAFIVSGYLGVALASYVGIGEDDFSGLPFGLAMQAGCTVLPLGLSWWIPDFTSTGQKPSGKSE